MARRPRIFFGWWVVTAAGAQNFYGSGVWFYGFPIFYAALLGEFGWSAAAGALVVSLSRLEGGILGPLLGSLVDRFGPRTMGMTGATMVGLGFLAMSRLEAFQIGPVEVTAFVAFLVLYAGWMSIGYSSGSMSRSAAVNAWFVKKRGRAFALYTIGAGASGATVALLGWLADDYGWRTAAFAAGAGVLALSVPLSALLRRRPEDYGYLPDGDSPDTSGQSSTRRASSVRSPRAAVSGREPDFTTKEALTNLIFWILVLSFAARNMASTSVVIHQVNYLTEVRDFTLLVASSILGTTVAISIAGRLIFGLAGDYVPKNYALTVGFLLQALGIWLLSDADTTMRLWIFAVVYGVGYGATIPVSMAIIGDYFGRRRYATIHGMVQFLLVPVTFAGPILAGRVFDVTGRYEAAFNVFIIVMLVGAGLMVFARKPSQARGGTRRGA